MRTDFQRFTSLDAEESGAAKQFDKTQWYVSEARAKFFERIALLSAGAVVLSVSLLSTVFGHTTIHGLAFLLLGWIALVIALTTSLFRDLRYHPYLLETSFGHYEKVLARKKDFLAATAAAGGTVLREDHSGTLTASELRDDAAEVLADAKNRKERANQLFAQTQRMELLALNAFWIGVLCLAVFAALNLILGANHYYFQ